VTKNKAYTRIAKPTNGTCTS